MREAIKTNPKDIPLLVRLGRALAFSNRFDEAEKYFQRVYELDPSDADVYLRIGIGYAEAGHNDEALTAIRKSLEKKENPSAYFNLATLLSERGDFEEATAAYENFLKFRPTDAPGIMALYAGHLEKAGKRREALTMYRRVLAIKPTDTTSLYRGGILSLKLLEPEAAKIYLETLKTVDPFFASKLAHCIRLRIW